MDSAAEKDLHSGAAAFRFEHICNVFRGAIAEELPERFLVVGDAMLLNECDEICGRVAGQGGFREVFVCGDKVFGPAMDVGEIAAASTGDENLLADAIGTLQNGDTPPAFPGFYGAKQASRPSAKNQSVKPVDQGKISSEAESRSRGFRGGCSQG
jgi:hypothetical protein